MVGTSLVRMCIFSVTAVALLTRIGWGDVRPLMQASEHVDITRLSASSYRAVDMQASRNHQLPNRRRCSDAPASSREARLLRERCRSMMLCSRSPWPCPSAPRSTCSTACACMRALGARLDMQLLKTYIGCNRGMRDSSPLSSPACPAWSLQS